MVGAKSWKAERWDGGMVGWWDGGMVGWWESLSHRSHAPRGSSSWVPGQYLSVVDALRPVPQERHVLHSHAGRGNDEIRFRRFRVGGNPVNSSIWIPAFAGMTNKSVFP